MSQKIPRKALTWKVCSWITILSHSTKLTIAHLSYKSIKEFRLMEWVPFSPDINTMKTCGL